MVGSSWKEVLGGMEAEWVKAIGSWASGSDDHRVPKVRGGYRAGIAIFVVSGIDRTALGHKVVNIQWHVVPIMVRHVEDGGNETAFHRELMSRHFEGVGEAIAVRSQRG